MDEEKKEIILGLDISTKTIGCCLLLNDGSKYGKIIELTHVSPKVSKKTDKTQSLFEKTEIFRNEFLNKYKNLGISKVVIESPLLTSNNSVTCGELLKFNGMISLAVYEELHVVPSYITSYEARKYSFPELMSIRKFGKEGENYKREKILSAVKNNKFVLFGSFPWDVDKKSVLQSNVAEIFPNIEWIYNKKGELSEENFDAVDSYVACYGQMNKEKNGELEFTSSNIVDNGNSITYDLNYWNETKQITIKI